MSRIQGSSNQQPAPISDVDKKAVNSESVQTALKKVKSDVANGATKDVLDKDKSDAFSKYQAAGGQATSVQAFGEEATQLSGGEKASLQKAFDLTDGIGGSSSAGIGGSSSAGIGGSSSAGIGGSSSAGIGGSSSAGIGGSSSAGIGGSSSAGIGGSSSAGHRREQQRGQQRRQYFAGAAWAQVSTKLGLPSGP